MDTKDDGGSAFPVPGVYNPAGGSDTQGCQGMTLLDYFAGQVLNGLCADPTTKWECQALVSQCYTLANCMIAERAKW